MKLPEVFLFSLGSVMNIISRLVDAAKLFRGLSLFGTKKRLTNAKERFAFPVSEQFFGLQGGRDGA